MIREMGRAKVNLALDIVGQRADGYHLVRMVMHSVGIEDVLEISLTENEGEILLEPKTAFPEDDAKEAGTEEANKAPLSYGEDNLIVKAGRLLFREAEKRGGEAAEKLRGKGVHIFLEKNIPIQAGMAGGSTDCAAALRGINRILELDFTEDELCTFGAMLGADVPFCIKGGTALSEGIGEILTPLPSLPESVMLIAKPTAGISTPAAYKGYDELMKKAEAGELPFPKRPDLEGMIQSLREGNLQGVAGAMGNVLEPVTCPLCPEIAKLEEEMLAAGAIGAQMSGSGPTVFGIFANAEDAWKTAEKLSEMNLAESIFVV